MVLSGITLMYSTRLCQRRISNCVIIEPELVHRRPSKKMRTFSLLDWFLDICSSKDLSKDFFHSDDVIHVFVVEAIFVRYSGVPSQ